MKTQRELNLHYWGVIHDMVEAYNKEHGCDVKPWECVQFEDTRNWYTRHPSFGSITITPESYKFAVAILYDEKAGVHRPVFPGDTVFWKANGSKFIVQSESFSHNENYKYLFTWHKPLPKRAFEINGVELPCPVKNEESYEVRISGSPYYFKSLDEAVTVGRLINKILTEARDKP